MWIICKSEQIAGVAKPRSPPSLPGPPLPFPEGTSFYPLPEHLGTVMPEVPTLKYEISARKC